MADNYGSTESSSRSEPMDLPPAFDAATLDILSEDLPDIGTAQNKATSKSPSNAENVPIRPKTCVVCGDRAHGLNFSAVTCGSCKAFFRRNALKTKIAPCLFTGSCPMTTATRNFCPPCRLDKCFAAGMKTEHIMSQDAKDQRKKLIEKNRRRKLNPSSHSAAHSFSEQKSEDSNRISHHSSENRSDGTGCSTSSNSCIKSPTSQAPADDECIAIDVRLATAERPTHVLSVDADAPLGVEPRGGDSTVDAAISGRYAALFQRVQIALARSSLQLQRRLVSGDEARLGSVARTYQSTVGVDPSIEAPEPPEGFTPELFAIRTSNLLRQMVLFAKETPHFAGLPRSTQIRLLRAGAMQCILLRSAELLDLGSESWVNHSGVKLSLDILNDMSPDAVRDNFFVEHLSLSASVKHLVPADRNGKSDSMVFALLLLIALLSPDHLGSITDYGEGDGPAAVSDAQQHYVLLLRRHLEATYSFQLCATVLPALLQQINVLKRHSKKQNNGFMSCLAVRKDPLCQEVLEL